MSKLSNLKARVFVAVIVGPLLLGLTYLGDLFFFALALGITLLSMYELNLLLKARDSKTPVWLDMGLTTIVLLNFKFGFTPAEHILFGVVSIRVLYEMFRNEGSALLNTGGSLLSIMYLGLSGGAIVLLREQFIDQTKGGLFLIALLLTVWTGDTVAYFIGSAFGKHRLFERVSPKKSWEGFWAGLIGSMVIMVVFAYTMLPWLKVPYALVIGVIVGTVGVLGDLAESLFKRDSGIKDSSNLIPGHGGVFDRFDSLFASAPVIYLFLQVFEIK